MTSGWFDRADIELHASDAQPGGARAGARPAAIAERSFRALPPARARALFHAARR